MKPEVHAAFLAPLVDEADRLLGEGQVDGLLRAATVDRALVSDRSAWISLEVCQDLVHALVTASGDPLFVRRTARLAYDATYMGPLRGLLRTFGHPASAYEQMTKALARFNKVGELSVLERGAGRVVLRYVTAEGAPRETEPLVCLGRLENIAALPTLFDLPMATVRHPTCLHEGADACIYEVEFTARIPRWRSRLGFLAGGATAAVLASQASSAFASPALVVGGAGLLGAVGIWSFFRQLELKWDVAAQARTVLETNEALTQSVTQLEERFEQLQDAKSAVERRVEERTAELHRTTGQLAQTLEELRGLSEAKTNFFANVSHELRTPLTLILAATKKLAEALESSPEVVSLDANARRLHRLIDQLLDVSKVDAGKATLSTSPIDVTQLVDACVDPFRLAATERGLELETEVDAPHVLELDAEWMSNALTNLLANALRYARGRISVRAHDTGGDITFEVSDDGPGIPAEDLERVFERFERASDERSRSGTGLGLAIVKEAARLHGGSASVESQQDKGSVFRIQLPRVVARRSPVPVLRTEVSHPTRGVDGARVGDVHAPLVLVVEDHPDLARFIVEVLSARYQVQAFGDAESALAAATVLRPAAVVTDVSLPGISGLELTGRLRNTPKTSDLPIVLVTARGEPHHVLEGFDAGADDYLVKPFHGRELLARLDVHMRVRRLGARLAHQERLATLGVLAASVAHHVRNPLTALVSGLPAVRKKLEGKVDPRTEEMLGLFVECAHRIERITLDLLDLSRVDREEEGELVPGQGLMAAVRLLSARLPDDITVETEVDLETRVSGRPGDLNHVFLNLIDNAARAVGARGRIFVSGTAEAGRYVITVEDSGPGFDDDIVDRALEPFVTSRVSGEGTGLGLSVADDVMRAHGGSVVLGTSERLGGACVTLNFPLRLETSLEVSA